MADRNALAPALMPPQLTSGPEPRWRNRLADAIHGYVPSLADRLNDPFSGAGVAVDALGTMVASPVEAMSKYFANPYQPGERTPENRNALMHGFEAAGLAAAGGAMAPAPRGALAANRFSINYFGKPVTILENPSPRETAGFMSRTKYKAARRIVDPATKTTYIWDAADPALHALVAKELGIDPAKMTADMIGLD